MLDLLMLLLLVGAFAGAAVYVPLCLAMTRLPQPAAREPR